jgi:hypothetical protein
VAPQLQAGGVDRLLPHLTRQQVRQTVQQAVRLFQLGEPSELLAKRMIVVNHPFLLIQNQRGFVVGVVPTVQLATAQGQLDRPQDRWMRTGLEVRARQVGNLAGEAMQLDHVSIVDFAQIRPGATLVDPQGRFQGGDGRLVHEQRVRRKPSHT